LTKFKIGDSVQIATREQTSEDIRLARYYNYFGGLVGTIMKLYGQEAAIQIDTDSLEPDFRERHQASEKRMHERWLNNLSEEAKTRLTPEEMDFHLDYTLLVSMDDILLLKEGDGKAVKPVSKKKEVEAKTAEPKPMAVAQAEAIEENGPQLFEVPERKTMADLERAEEEMLRTKTSQ